MKRIMCVVLVLLTALVGCKDKGPAQENIEMPKKEYIVDGQYKFSDEEVYLNDVKISDMVEKNRDEIFNLLGDDYELVYGWADGSDREGYAYSEYGIRIFFGEESGIIESITCGERATVNGVGLGMTFTEVQNILGVGEIVDFGQNAHSRYALRYKYQKFALWIGTYDEGGETIEFQIRFNIWY